MRTCSLCDSPAVSRALCNKHRMRLVRTGNTSLPPRTVTVKLHNVVAEKARIQEAVAEMERLLSSQESEQ